MNKDYFEASRLLGKAVEDLKPHINPWLSKHIKKALERHGKIAEEGFHVGQKESRDGTPEGNS